MSIKKAALISAVSKYSTILLNLVFSAILARLLSPEDYGIVAVTVVFTTFFALFSDMGIGSGIIQNKDLSQKDIDSIFTFSIILALVLCVAFILFSFPMSRFYKDEVYIPVGILLSISLLFSTLNMVPNAILLKQKKFVSVGLRTVIICIVSGIVGIVFACLGLKFYALVFQNIINSVCVFLWNYLSTKPKVVKKINWNSISKIKNFSLYLFAFNIINYFSRNTDNLLISKFMGTSALGYYDKAYKLMCYPTQNLTHVITPVLHPILSEHQNDKMYIYEKYLEIVKLLSLCGIFIMPFCFFASDEIILLLFGEKWIFAVPSFKFLSISIWAQLITSSSGSIFQSLGDSKKMFTCGWVNALITVAAIILGILEGDIVSVARNVGVVFNVHFITTYIILISGGFKMSYIKFIKFLFPDFFLIILMFFSGTLINVLVGKLLIENIFLKCCVRFFMMFTVYVCSLFFSKQYKYLTKFFRRKRTKTEKK